MAVYDPSIDDSVGGPVRVEVWLKTDNTGTSNEVAGISFPVIITSSNPNANPVLDTTVSTTFYKSDISQWSQLVHNAQYPPDSFPMETVVGGLTTGAGLTAGQYLIATFVIDLEKTTTLSFDTTSFGLGPTQLNLSTSFGADYTPYWQQTDVVVAGYPTRQPPIFIRAHSPVNLIVTDPNGDSIGVDFNTIHPESAYYDVSTDSIAIYKTYEGDYKIKVVRDPDDPDTSTSYTIEARIDGTADQVIASNQPVPDTGEVVEIQVTNDPDVLGCLARPGDANADGNYTLSDVIAMVNYVFLKPGCSPQPLCWLSNLLCRGDWNASGNVTLSDVIQAVNFVFNKPGGPWNATAVDACCLP